MIIKCKMCNNDVEVHHLSRYRLQNLCPICFDEHSLFFCKLCGDVIECKELIYCERCKLINKTEKEKYCYECGSLIEDLFKYRRSRLCSEKCLNIRKNNDKKRVFKVKENSKSFKEYWLKRLYCEEDAIQLALKYSRLNSVRCVEYWVKVGLSEDEALSKVSEVQSTSSQRCKEYWIDKGYSEEESLSKVSEVQRCYSFSYLNNHTDHEIRTRSPRCIEYWLNKGFNEEEAKFQLRIFQDNSSKESFVNKYGEVDGDRRYKDFVSLMTEINNNRVKKFLPYSSVSSISQDIFHLIYNRLSGYDTKIYFHELNTEFGLRDVENKNYYKYDFTDNFNKIIIEFNGDYWHCNPDLYESTYYHKQLRKTAQEKWDEDANKIKCAKEKGYNVLIVWEKDIKDYGIMFVVDKILKFYKEILNENKKKEVDWKK